MKRTAHEWLLKNTEDYKYTICSSQRDYNEFNLSLADDNGSNNLSYILSLAKKDNKKIFISGGGADEMYDYGGKYLHSNFNGIFPMDLKTIFPWNSVFGSSMSSYIMKDEMVGGSYGLETRFPFINREIWQEFLWLSPKLKNKCYKSAMDNYLMINGFPYQPGEKIGF
jgi:asparagine synthetase B (glutamine-hydrolysing)